MNRDPPRIKSPFGREAYKLQPSAEESAEHAVLPRAAGTLATGQISNDKSASR
jgi:hypothetical protein